MHQSYFHRPGLAVMSCQAHRLAVQPTDRPEGPGNSKVARVRVHSRIYGAVYPASARFRKYEIAVPDSLVWPDYPGGSKREFHNTARKAQPSVARRFSHCIGNRHGVAPIQAGIDFLLAEL